MSTLALDTATFVATVAVTHGEDVLAEISWGLKKSHSERILPAIDLVLEQSGLSLGDIKRIAVSLGPGSFTGLRIGMGLAKGISEGRGIPLVGVSTLRVLAEQAILHEGVIIPLLSAQRGQFYGACFSSCGGKLTTLHADSVISPLELKTWVSESAGKVLFTGEAALEARSDLDVELAPAAMRTPRAGVMGVLACEQHPLLSHEVVPNYIRPSSAQPRKGSVAL